MLSNSINDLSSQISVFREAFVSLTLTSTEDIFEEEEEEKEEINRSHQQPRLPGLDTANNIVCSPRRCSHAMKNNIEKWLENKAMIIII